MATTVTIVDENGKLLPSHVYRTKLQGVYQLELQK